jgi:MoaA/NifB/PqqE/SkfB family radical SAM enzyme
MPVYLLKQQHQYPVSAQQLKSFRCLQIFSSLLIDGYGDVYLCCETWIPEKIGNLIETTAETILNGSKLHTIIEDMNRGEFSYCNDQCPSLSNFLHNRPQTDIVPVDTVDNQLATKSFHVNLNYDQSCNLQCPSCRHELIMLDSGNPTTDREIHMVKLHQRVKDMISLLIKKHHSVTLGITGSGDPFAGPLYWNYLKELASNGIPDNLFLNLQTNGLLMTKENLDKIKPIWNNITHIAVSTDAATTETYAIVRKNGVFNKLKRNLELLDNLIMDGCFPNMHTWQTNFIVQRDNFRELLDYIKWQLSFKSKPVIWTHLISQWYHIDDSDFKQIAVHLSTHEFHAELKEILADPIFNNEQIKLGNLNSLI